MKKKSFLILVLIIILSFTMGCNTSTQDTIAIDDSFLTGIPCAAPCWHSLELDKSSEQDVRTTISQLPFVVQHTIHEQKLGTDAKVIGFDCTYKTEGNCGELLISGDKLKTISMVPGYELTFKMVVDQLGSPDQISRIGDLAGSSCSTSLHWLQVSVSTRENGKCPPSKSLIEPSAKVANISYRLPGSLCFGCISWPGFLEP